MTQQFILGPQFTWKGFFGFNDEIYVIGRGVGTDNIFQVVYNNPGGFVLVSAVVNELQGNNFIYNQKYTCLDIDLTEIIFGTSPTPTPTITKTKTPTPTVTPTGPELSVNCLTGMKVVFRYNKGEGPDTPLDDRCPCDNMFDWYDGVGYRCSDYIGLRARYLLKINGVIIEPVTPTCFDGQGWGYKTWSINNQCAQFVFEDTGFQTPTCDDQCYDRFGGTNSDLWNGCREDFNFPPGQNMVIPWNLLSGPLSFKVNCLGQANNNRYSYGIISQAQAQVIANSSPNGCIDIVLQCWMPSDRCCNYALDGFNPDCSNTNVEDGEVNQLLGTCWQEQKWIQVYKNINGVETRIFNGCTSASSSSSIVRLNVCSGRPCGQST